MSEKINGIVLNVRKYNDRNNIVTLYTRERGRLSFISPTGSGKASNVRRARLQPLAVVTTDLSFKASTELQRLGSISSARIWNDIYFHPTKRAIALFISEFLYRLLKETASEPPLFDFLVNSFSLFDETKENISDFHIPFLISLLTFTGIKPDTKGYKEGYVFDFESGIFLPEFEAKGPVLRNEEAAAAVWISRINFLNMKRLRFTNANRRQIINVLLNYFSYHFPGLGELKSPDILREIFS